jgi:hypothetical protein
MLQVINDSLCCGTVLDIAFAAMAVLDNIDPDEHYFDAVTECTYYDAQPFRDTFKPLCSTSLMVFHLNIRSIAKNLDELLVYLESLAVRFHVLVLTESWLNGSSAWLDVPGYTAYHSVRQNMMGGGVSVLVSDQLESEILPKYSFINDVFEMCSVRLTIEKKSYNVLGVYRPPDKSCVEFNKTFFELIGVDEITNSFCIFLGDFNLNMLSSVLPDAVEVYISEFRSLHFLPYISLPTRVKDNSQTLIDHIWINALVPCQSGVFPVHITDHYPIFISVPNLFLKKSKLIKCEFRCHDDKCIVNFKVRVNELVNGFSVNDALPVDVRWNKLCHMLHVAYKKCCPVKVKHLSVKRFSNPWLNNDLLQFIDMKHELGRLSRHDHRYLELFKHHRNLLPTKIWAAKKNYFRLKFEKCANDIKKTWNSINQILRPNSKRNIISEVTVGDAQVTDPLLIPRYFNDHYTSVANNLALKIPHINADPTHLVQNCANSFVFFPPSGQEVNNIILSFKSKGSNLNSIPSFIFKHITSEISPLVAQLINESFSEGTFPDILKVARVIPIFKAGRRDIIANYRPISTLHFLSKVFEKIVFNRMVAFFNKFDVISAHQFGFRRGRSTGDALLRYTDAIYEALNCGKSVVSVLLDLSKAFDTVDHDILLNKLSKVGIRGCSLQWFKSYLTNRVQYVEVNGTQSTSLPINIGVPQGSILGPLLFLVYINDMSKCSDKLSFVHFADDTTVFLSGVNVADIIPAINRELVKVDSWLCSNKLSLNLDKTVYMVHTNKLKNSDDQVIIRNKVVCHVDKSKFLGIIVDNKLKFKDHVSEVCSKMSKTCGILRRLGSIVPSHVLKSVYLSLVYPYIIYGVEVWGDCCKTKLSRLCSIQDQCVRLVGSRIPGELCEKYKQLNFISYHSVYKYFTTMKFFQYFVLNRSNYFQNRIHSYQVPHLFDTRFKSHNGLNLPFYHLSSCQSSFLYNSISLWNKTPHQLKQTTSYQTFKRSLKKHYLNAS